MIALEFPDNNQHPLLKPCEYEIALTLQSEPVTLARYDSSGAKYANYIQLEAHMSKFTA